MDNMILYCADSDNKRVSSMEHFLPFVVKTVSRNCVKTFLSDTQLQRQFHGYWARPHALWAAVETFFVSSLPAQSASPDGCHMSNEMLNTLHHDLRLDTEVLPSEAPWTLYQGSS